MIINKLIKQKNNKYKIITDDVEIITYDNVILEYELLYKKSIDKETYENILKDTSFYDIYNKTVKYILKRLRSEFEIRNYLVRYNMSHNDIEKIISKLKDINLINDKEYVKSYINDKVYLDKCGINKIRNHLSNQNIDLHIIEEELSKIDNNVLDDNLKKIILNKLKHNKKYSNYEIKNKIMNEMISQGYDKDKVIEIIESNIQEDSNIINKEYIKIYNKLSKKYSGNELLYNVKQKLYQRGFESERITELLDEKKEDFI